MISLTTEKTGLGKLIFQEVKKEDCDIKITAPSYELRATSCAVVVLKCLLLYMEKGLQGTTPWSEGISYFEQ
jgi:hypothetical protein